MPNQNPTILVPGIKGSSLENYYALTPETTWSGRDAVASRLVGPDLEELALDDTGSFDRSLSVVTRANGLLEVAYGPLVKALRSRRKHVYVFPYDWRYSVVRSAAALQDFVALIQTRTKANAIDFVCHSMGGLVFRAFLKQAGRDRVGRVVFLGVPHHGSLDAVEGMIRGETVLLGGDKSARKLARTLPGVYDLLPSFSDALIDETGTSRSVYDINVWQGNVRANGPEGPEANGFDVSVKMLSEADKVRTTQLVPATRDALGDEVLTIYGKDWDTLGKVKVGAAPDRHFDFENAEMIKGDGVVPTISALIAGIPSIGLTRRATSVLELTARIKPHAFMGSLDEVQTMVNRFLDGVPANAVAPRNLENDFIIPT